MDKPLYHVRGWAETFERAQSRRVNSLSWFAMVNTFDSKRIRRLASMQNGAAHFGCFVLMLELTSRLPYTRRGYLEDSDGPMGPEEMALVTCFPAESFRASIDVLLGLGLLEVVQSESQSIPAMSVNVDAMSVNVDAMSVNNPMLDRVEKKREEKKREEETISLSPDQPGYWAERMYERHPKKKDLVLVHPVVEKLFAKHGADELKRIDGMHERKCKEWQAEPKFAPSLAKWLEDRGWTEVKPAYVSETKLWDPMEGLRD